MDSRIYTEWDLAKEVKPFNKLLSRYYLIYWDYNYFNSRIIFTSSGVQIIHQGVTYDARLLASEDWREFQKSKRVCLSFRAWTDPESGELTGVVLVKRAA